MNSETKIPHTIHYCWFGNNPKPKLINKCISSWREYQPDWEIIEWNESNYDISAHKYTKDAYEQKKWAFVVDYARFDILNRYGGVFLDTDVELLRSIPDEFLAYESFTGFESEKTVNPGLIYASIPKQKMLTDILASYENKEFGARIDGRPENIVDIVTAVLLERGLKQDNSFQIINGVAIYPQNIFCCFDHETQSFDITHDTVSIHHYYASWSPWYRKAYFRTIKYAARILGKERYLKFKKWIKRRG